jgi:BMP and activin membrane-bound inhibitor
MPLFARVCGSAGETRCYCNEAGCVSTGYMCKSGRLGACFSQLSRDGLSVRSTHGCAESLPEIDYDACARSAGTHVTSGSAVLICCRDDMCNYMDSVGISDFFSRRDNEHHSTAVAASSSRRAHGRSPQ